MQVIYILAVLGAFFGISAGFISQLTVTTQKLNEEYMKATEEYFTDIQQYVVDQVLSEHPDIQSSGVDLNNIFTEPTLQVSTTVTWPSLDFTTDAWQRPFTVYAVSAPYAFAAASGVATTQVWAVALVSSGPDLRVDEDLQTALDGAPNYLQTLNLDTVGGADSDDIVHTFTTMPAMFRTFNEVNDMFQKVIAQATNQYVQEYKTFLPEIRQFYFDNFDTFIDPDAGAGGFDTFLLSDANLFAWQEDPGLLADPDYPDMPASIDAMGMGDEIANALFPQMRMALNREAVAVADSDAEEARKRREASVAVDIVGDQELNWNIDLSYDLDGQFLLQ